MNQTKIVNSSRYERPIKLGQLLKRMVRIKKIKNILKYYGSSI